MSLLTKPLKATAVATLIGFLAGGLIGNLLDTTSTSITGEAHALLPHQVAKMPDGVSLRFAMVHDVIHERFPKHGDEYYRARNAASEAELTKLRSLTHPLSNDEYMNRGSAMDDLAVGYVHLGDYARAIQIMRQKLALTAPQGTDNTLYSTYANLGTAMMIDSLHRSLWTDIRAQAQLRESIELIGKSIQIDPDAHFGREIWQKRLGEFLISAVDDPEILTQQDMIGQRFSSRPLSHNTMEHPATNEQAIALRPITRELADGDLAPNQRTRYRLMIRRVGREKEGDSLANEAYSPDSVPFDEPTLAIIGMWRYGGGANPHFAVCLGEIMLRVGQRYIAWNAYERAIRLADDISPDSTLRERFIEQCRARQKTIETSLVGESVEKLTAAFDRELQDGLTYQREYQQYEAAQIGAGKSLDAPDFYSEFDKTHASIASPPGDADSVDLMPYRRHFSFLSDTFIPMGILFGGLIGFFTACVVRSN